jgi:hypothetical protein
MADVMGEQDLRAQHWAPIVQGFALQEYRMKQVVTITSSTAWIESFYQETSTELTGGTGSTIKGIPRGAAFPHGEPSWTLSNARHEKYGMQGTIFWEDMATSNFDIVARTLLRIGRAVASAVDTQIYSGLSSATGNTVAAAATWDAAVIANRDPIQDILNAIKLCAEDNYDVVSGRGYLLLSPKDFANLLGNANVRNAGQFYTDEVTRNGKVGKLLGLSVIVSNAVTADQAMVIIGQEAATWQQAQALRVVSIEDPGVKWTIRAFEVGVIQVTNPNAICTITNTQA